jgi:hypothetical protein
MSFQEWKQFCRKGGLASAAKRAARKLRAQKTIAGQKARRLARRQEGLMIPSWHFLATGKHPLELTLEDRPSISIVSLFCQVKGQIESRDDGGDCGKNSKEHD